MKSKVDLRHFFDSKSFSRYMGEVFSGPNLVQFGPELKKFVSEPFSYLIKWYLIPNLQNKLKDILHFQKHQGEEFFIRRLGWKQNFFFDPVINFVLEPFFYFPRCRAQTF